jgi:hypothetical protein
VRLLWRSDPLDDLQTRAVRPGPTAVVGVVVSDPGPVSPMGATPVGNLALLCGPDSLGLEALPKCRNRHLRDRVCYRLGDSRRCHSRFGKPTINRSKRSQNRACPTDHDAYNHRASAQEHCAKLSEPGKSRR